MLRRLVRTLFVLAFIACGARTSLPGGDSVDPIDSSVDDAQEAGDVRPDTVPPDAKPDVLPPIDAPACSVDADCDDLVSCTKNVCHPSGRCIFTADDTQCADFLFCNGSETCDAVKGCLAGTPPCGDGVACTVDKCSENARTCTYTPDDTLCPISHGCDPIDGCQARALAHDDKLLYEVRLPSGKLRTIGPIGVVLTDLALHPTNVLFGIRRNEFYVLNQTTGAATLVGSTGSQPWTGLDADPSGQLYGAAGNLVYRLTLSGGATQVATYPNNYFSSGDLAFLQGRLVATVHFGASGDDALAEVNLVTQTSKILGQTSFPCIYGLAAFGPTLYGLTCEGRILSINGTNGAATEVNRVNGVSFGGASAR